MADRRPSPVDYGFRGRFNWVLSGAISGVAGAMAFGAFFGLIYPDVVAVTIPSLYGIKATRSTGWALHLLHGLVLGVVFGFVVTRKLVLRALVANPEPRHFEGQGPSARLTALGMGYALLVWLAIPLVALPIWVVFTGGADPDFPTATVESLLAHLIFGGMLGFVFSNFINISAGARKR